MDWRPFSLRQPGLLTATEIPQPSEHDLSLQNCAQRSKSRVVRLPFSLRETMSVSGMRPALAWREAARTVMKKVLVEYMFVKKVWFRCGCDM
jgi:hypothetical protein